MCIALPARIVNILNHDDDTSIAEVVLNDTRLSVDITYIPEAKVGDYIIVHAGIGVRVVDKEYAKYVYSLLEE
jgi:hydrogenase expression/formation protein HypC